MILCHIKANHAEFSILNFFLLLWYFFIKFFKIWNIFIVEHNWAVMRQNVQDHIGSLNWNYKVQLRTEQVKYINAYGQFVENHKIKVNLLLITDINWSFNYSKINFIFLHMCVYISYPYFTFFMILREYLCKRQLSLNCKQGSPFWINFI